MFQEYRDLLSAFNAHGVKYLIVGGYAVSFHAQPRATKDIDLLVQASPANAKALYAALAEFGAPLHDVQAEDLADPASFFRFGKEPLSVDILSEIPGVDFNAAWERRVEGVVDKQSGLTACFISKKDLISAKVAAGRARDLADVEEIRGAERSDESVNKPATGDPS